MTWMRHLWIMLKRELLLCFRDSDVMLYSFLMPLLFWPFLVLSVSEYFIWQSGVRENAVVRVCFESPPSPEVEEVRECFRSRKGFLLVNEPDGSKALEGAGACDAFVKRGSDGEGIEVLYHDSRMAGQAAKSSIERELCALQNRNLTSNLSRAGKSKNFLETFFVDVVDLSPVGAGKDTKRRAPVGAVRMAFILLLSLSLTSVAYGVMAPAVAIFTCEREKGTVSTTLLLPVSRKLTALSKILTTTTVGVGAGLVNLVSATTAVLAVIFQIGVYDLLNVTGVFLETFKVHTILCFFLLMVLYSFTTAVLLCALSIRSKDYSQAYNMLSVPIVWAGVVPFLALIPMLHLDGITSLVPFANFAFLLKDLVTGKPQLPAVLVMMLETAVIIFVCFKLVVSYLDSEKILAGADS